MQRPKRKENEDDLLRFQEQFLRQGADPSAKVQRVRRDVTESARDIVKLDETGEARLLAFVGPRPTEARGILLLRKRLGVSHISISSLLSVISTLTFRPPNL